MQHSVVIFILRARKLDLESVPLELWPEEVRLNVDGFNKEILTKGRVGKAKDRELV